MFLSSAENEQDWQAYPVDPYFIMEVTLGKTADYHLGVGGLFIPPLCSTLVLI